ncbi:SEC14 [Symbiodinium microadriaticum]|nr:SEC14 [Symbiodinium microadriaticum]
MAWLRTVWCLGSLCLAWALRVDDRHPPPCREEYTCDAGRVNESAQSQERIAVYTYNIGGYEEMRGDHIPCVPSHLDAFLFVDEVSQKRFGMTAVKKWQEMGWRVVNFSQVEGTKYVPSSRLTSKSLKFEPPGWLLNGTWQWLVEYDGNIVVDLHRLAPFLQRRREQALVLLNWGYHQDCSDDSFKCFMTEVTSMLTERVEYVARSKENVLKWKELLDQMHQGRLTQGGRKYMPSNYYETNVMFRNLNHAKADKVRDAFKKTFLKCHEIQRDQFVLPFFLWQDGLDEDTQASPIETLVDELGYCMVGTSSVCTSAETRGYPEAIRSLAEMPLIATRGTSRIRKVKARGGIQYNLELACWQMGAPSRKALHASFRAAVAVAFALVVWQNAATALVPGAKDARELGVEVQYADAVAELGKRLANRSFSHRFRHPLMLLRFLTCTTTLEEAEAMLVACEEWRQKVKIESIMQEWGESCPDQGSWKLSPKSPRAGLAAEFFAAERLPGTDAFGGPMMLGRHNAADMAGIYREDMATLLENEWVFLLEDMLWSAHAASVKQQRMVRGTTIIDAAGVSLSIVRYLPTFKPWLVVMNEFYPDLVRAIIVINAPAVFVEIWRVLSVLIAPTTAAKVRIYGSDFVAPLREHGVDLEILPSYLGGQYQGSRLSAFMEIPKGTGQGVNVSFGGS